MTITYIIHSTEIKIKVKALLEYKNLFRGRLWLQNLWLQFITTLEELNAQWPKYQNPI